MDTPTLTAAVHTTAPELTIYHVAELKGQWLDAYGAGCRQFDLSGVTEIDSAGVQLLASLRRLAQERGEPLNWIAPSPSVDALALEMNVAWLRASAVA